jgi:hypothetical protein
MELIVGPVARCLLRDGDKTLIALFIACRSCLADIPLNIMHIALAARRSYPFPRLGQDVFRAALCAGRTADEMDHILVVFRCGTPPIASWLAARSDADTLFARLAPLHLTLPRLFHDAAKCFATQPALLSALCDTPPPREHLVRDLFRVHGGFPLSVRPAIVKLLQGRHAVGLNLLESEFLRFLENAGDEEFQWMVEHCPITAEFSLETLKRPAHARVPHITAHYPYIVRRAFHAHAYRVHINLDIEDIDRQWLRLLYEDNQAVLRFLDTSQFSTSGLCALVRAGVKIPASWLLKKRIPADEVLARDALTEDEKLVSDYLALTRDIGHPAASGTPTAAKIRAHPRNPWK